MKKTFKEQSINFSYYTVISVAPKQLLLKHLVCICIYVSVSWTNCDLKSLIGDFEGNFQYEFKTNQLWQINLNPDVFMIPIQYQCMFN